LPRSKSAINNNLQQWDIYAFPICSVYLLVELEQVNVGEVMVEVNIW